LGGLDVGEFDRDWREARHHAKHVTKGMLNAAAKSVASVATKMRDSAVQVILATMRLPHYE
jgi:malic enzyme